MNAITTPKQNLLDIALQHCGAFEAAFQLALLNKRDLTSDLATGEQITLSPVQHAQTVLHYRTHRICPATAITNQEIEQIKIGGINYWAIQLDFTVS
ncbi:MAG: hypothetical protein NC038_05460 [Paludibacter sp.]|nr:hypothetical protein [Bacteroidales bacterium]MCM1069818.1 hypothetical protein [Prevotella sp.]MCM1353988.1 hypothetical protein [Bacteroides sp.]MCM1443370.1 hypothetical protein [Muribaculum sp.]MCM1482073.1 hypothetical protein [Paludibacter sp.]